MFNLTTVSVQARRWLLALTGNMALAWPFVWLTEKLLNVSHKSDLLVVLAIGVFEATRHLIRHPSPKPIRTFQTRRPALLLCEPKGTFTRVDAVKWWFILLCPNLFFTFCILLVCAAFNMPDLPAFAVGGLLFSFMQGTVTIDVIRCVRWNTVENGPHTETRGPTILPNSSSV